MRLLDSLLRIAGVLFIIAFVYYSFVLPRPPLGVQTRKRPPAGIVWNDAAHYANEAHDVDLLIAFARSKMPDVRKYGIEQLRRADPSEKTIAIWEMELNSETMEFRYDALNSFRQGAIKLGFNPKELPLCPASDLFYRKPDYYSGLWRSWWSINKESFFTKAFLLENKLLEVSVTIPKEYKTDLANKKRLILTAQIKNNDREPVMTSDIPINRGLIFCSADYEKLYPTQYAGSTGIIDLAPGASIAITMYIPIDVIPPQAKTFVVGVPKLGTEITRGRIFYSTPFELPDWK